VVNLEVQLPRASRARACWTRCTPCSPCTWTAFVIRDPKRVGRGLVAAKWSPRERAVRGRSARSPRPRAAGMPSPCTSASSASRARGRMWATSAFARRAAPLACPAHAPASPTCVIVAPPALMPERDDSQAVRRHTQLATGLKGATCHDAAHPEGAHGQGYCRTAQGNFFRGPGADARAPGPGAPDAIVMHPQPMKPRHRDPPPRGDGTAVRHPRPGAQRRGGAHGGARRKCHSRAGGAWTGPR